jgi:hypothetical protein
MISSWRALPYLTTARRPYGRGHPDRTRTAKGVTLKVSEKGGVSVYGLGRFPVTLYKEQWAKLLDMANNIRAFIVEHEAELKTKEKEV